MIQIDEAAELWRPVVGHEGLYEVSDQGRVRSVARWVKQGTAAALLAGRILKLWIDKDGYSRVQLSAGNISKGHRVHRLVCEAFHGGAANPDFWVRHLNGNPADNRADNLQWGSSRENAQDTLRHGRNFSHNKTHCPVGHPYDEENTYINKRGHRGCRACRRKPGGSGAWSRRRTHCKHGHPRSVENTLVSKRGTISCRVCHREGERRRRQAKARVEQWDVTA